MCGFNYNLYNLNWGTFAGVSSNWLLVAITSFLLYLYDAVGGQFRTCEEIYGYYLHGTNNIGVGYYNYTLYIKSEVSYYW